MKNADIPTTIPYPTAIKLNTDIKYPTTVEMAQNFGNSTLGFVRSGFALADNETLSKRKEICGACEMWDSQALNGTGRCTKCGCSTWAKLRMASEKCPLEKW